MEKRNPRLNMKKWSIRQVCSELCVPVPDSCSRIADSEDWELTSRWSPLNQSSLYFDENILPEKVKKLSHSGVGAILDKEQKYLPDGSSFPTIILPNPIRAYIALMRRIRLQSNAQTIAVTGSNGKTTCREMLRLVSAEQYNTYWSKANGNVLGLIGSFIQRLPSDAEVYIQETGAYKPGLVEASGEMLAPDAALITNIGMAHAGDYGSKQAVLEDKLSLDNFLSTDGVFFVNFDDASLRSQKYRSRVVSYGVNSSDTDYGVSHTESTREGTSFDVVERETGSVTTVHLNVLGAHNISNALAVFAVGRWLGISNDAIARGLNRYRPEGTRQNLVSLGGNLVLVDCFNSTELSVLSVAKTLNELNVASRSKRILVLGEIPRLGVYTESVHRKLGEELAEFTGISEIYCIDEGTKWLADSARYKGVRVHYCDSKDILHAALRSAIKSGDVLAFKAGSPTALTLIVDRLFGSAFSARNSGYYRSRMVDSNGMRVRLVHDYGARVEAIESTGESAWRTDWVVGGDVEGQPLLMIRNYAFARSSVESVTVDSPVRSLGLGAFYMCKDLRTVALPSSLRFIGPGAFRGCERLENIVLPEGVATIRRNAFRGCRALKRLVIPRSLKTIDRGVFVGSPNVVLYCYEDSDTTEMLRTRMPADRLVVMDPSLDAL